LESRQVGKVDKDCFTPLDQKMAGRAVRKDISPLIWQQPVIRPLAKNLTKDHSSQDVQQASFFRPKRELMLPKGSFDGKIALITGGGTGLGRGMVKALSSLGAKVAIMSRRYDVLKKAAEEISNETGNEVLPVQGDVRVPEEVSTALDKVELELGLPNIIINNAAGNFISPFERLSPNAFKTIIDIVLLGTANITLDVGKRLIKAKQGANFLSISAVYATTGSGFVVPSAAAKAGVEAITKSLAVEWSRYGMRFNAIAPGPIKTEGAFSRLDPTGAFESHTIERNPSKRLGTIEELSNLVAYMVSDYSTWMNGEVVVFDGGESRSLAGEMNAAIQVSDDQWDMLEKMIRKGNSKL